MPLNDNLPVGSIIIWPGAGNDLPNNWMVCDGAELNKNDYSELFSALRTYWDNDDGSSANFFNIPDLRGVFLRGVNNGREGDYKDPDLINRERLKGGTGLAKDLPGSYQRAEIERHNHGIEDQFWGDESSRPEGVSGNTANLDGNFDSSQLATGIDRNNVPLVISHYGGNETRPVNAYVYFIIKVKHDL